MGEKNGRNNFFGNKQIVGAKDFGEKKAVKVRKTVFYNHTNIVTKKCGKNRAKQFF